MSLGGNFGNRWGNQNKPGQVVPCRILAKVYGGYDVEYGPRHLKGFLPTEGALTLGVELLLQFVGYRDHRAVFNLLHGSVEPAR
jgi:hypothetical protein